MVERVNMGRQERGGRLDWPGADLGQRSRVILQLLAVCSVARQ